MPPRSVLEAALGSDPADAPPLPELWQPLDILARCLKRGATLGHTDGGFYALLIDGAPVPGARARTLDELAAAVVGRLPPGRPKLILRPRKGLLAEVHRVIGRGESLSAFVGSALRREIAARQAEERALAWGDDELAPARRSDRSPPAASPARPEA